MKRVSDGDTLTVTDPSGKSISVRFACVDVAAAHQDLAGVAHPAVGFPAVQHDQAADAVADAGATTPAKFVFAEDGRRGVALESIVSIGLHAS